MNKFSLVLLPLLLITLLPSCGGKCTKKSCTDNSCKIEQKATESRESGPMQKDIDFEDEDMK
jgi:hypothetical protein